MTTNVLESMDVHVPVWTTYDQWTQFESFPRFMDGVERIDQVTDTRTHWVTSIAGVTREFDAEITEQHSDERVAWRTENGTHIKGDLRNFKEFIEARGSEEDGWRGDVPPAPQTGAS
jgi:uncharacterized membrane protein